MDRLEAKTCALGDQEATSQEYRQQLNDLWKFEIKDWLHRKHLAGVITKPEFERKSKQIAECFLADFAQLQELKEQLGMVE